jgi:hypothetical protein
MQLKDCRGRQICIKNLKLNLKVSKRNPKYLNNIVLAQECKDKEKQLK